MSRILEEELINTEKYKQNGDRNAMLQITKIALKSFFNALI